MCTSTFSKLTEDVSEKDLDEQGLIDNHSYTLMGVFKVTLDDMSEERLVKVRNPYGFKEWNGDWSDKSKKWTVKTRAQVEGSSKDDGIFFISLHDHLKFTKMTTICFYVEPRMDNFVVDQHELDQWGATKFTLERDHPQSLTISIDQISERVMDRKRNFSYDVVPVKIILTKLSSKIEDPDAETVPFEQTYIGGDSFAYNLGNAHAAVPFLQGLSKGVYMAFYQAAFTEAHSERKLVFSVYCQ